MKITISSQYGENVGDKLLAYKSRWFHKIVSFDVEFPDGFDQVKFDGYSDWAYQQAYALVQRDIKAYDAVAFPPLASPAATS